MLATLRAETHNQQPTNALYSMETDISYSSLSLRYSG